VASRQGEYQLPLAYTPWLIGPSSTYPPSMMAGGGGNTGMRLGGADIIIEPPEWGDLQPTRGLLWAFTSQPRKPPPRCT
jgi:hypothetical protein